MLLLRGQRLDAQSYEAFGRGIGPPYVETYDSLALPGHPALMQVGNVGPVLSRREFREGAGFWHTDRAYAPDCNAITMLFCVHAPAEQGETLFANQVAAYSELDADTRRRLLGRVARHRYGAGELEQWETAVHPMEDGQQARLPPAGAHPLARRHDVTGETALYAVAGSCVGVDGLTEAEWRPLLRELKAHATQPRFCHVHAWQPGDLLMWDNTTTLHCAGQVPAAVDERSRRLLYRYVVDGLSPLAPAAG
jgi:taurine dioxygenase